MGWKEDAEFIDPSTVEHAGAVYPVGQWLNGDPKMAAVGGIAHTGGLIMPVKYLDETLPPPPGWVRSTVAFSSGKQEEVFAARKFGLAVIRTRFRWTVTQQGVEISYPRDQYSASAGMRGHLQVLALSKAWEFPVVLTFKGKASQEMERMLVAFQQKVIAQANRLASAGAKKVAFPRFAFYMRAEAGGHVKVGTKGSESIITPPMLAVPEVVNAEYLDKIYVGAQQLELLTEWYREAEEWALAWGKFEPAVEEYPEEEQQPERQPSVAPKRAPVPPPLPPPEEHGPSWEEIERIGNGSAPAQPARQATSAPAQGAAKAQAPAKAGEAPKKKMTILDANEWRQLIAAAHALGYENGYHIQGALGLEGWEKFQRGDLAKAIEALKAHNAKKAKQEAVEEIRTANTNGEEVVTDDDF